VDNNLSIFPKAPLLASIPFVASDIPAIAPAPPEPESSLSDELSCCFTFNWSKLARLFAALAAFFVALVRLFTPDVALSELSEAFANSSLVVLTDDSSLDLLPVIISVKDLNALAKALNFPSNVLINFKTGVNTFINPCPILAFKLSICNESILVWFAQLSDVLAKSPEASANLLCTNEYLNATFSCSDILSVVLPNPFCNAY